MKKLNIFESGIIGFFIGVVISAYLTFIINTNGFVGEILNYLSLRPILNQLLQQFQFPDSQIIIISFVFFILVYTLYGFIIGLIIKFINKSSLVLIPLTLLLIIIGFEQKIGSKQITQIPDIDSFQSASIIKSIPKVPKQYFGNEVLGDLNGDGKDDIAFIINRNDGDRGMLYYLTTALSSDIGHTGTNLIFLGDKVNPQIISIKDGIIIIDYLINSNINSTSTKQFYAKIINGELTKIDSIQFTSINITSTSTDSSIATSTETI